MDKENTDKAAEKCVREIMSIERKKEDRVQKELDRFVIERVIYQKRRRRSC